ncbi:MAG: DUF1573 domain-containing protein [Candidatus Magasanikbacteria bacterium]|nr:DUF1573 domain-containing protein [Candidatus Magasanikbacteria bacterium]
MNNKNTILIFLGAVILVIAGAAFYNYQTAAPGAALPAAQNNQLSAAASSLVVEPQDYNLGTVIYGEIGKYILQVKNTGGKPVKILRLSTSCGCTKAVMDEKDKEIAPGQTVKIEVTFDPAVHKDDTDVGEIKRVIYIGTDEPGNPEIEAKFNAIVIKK